MKVCVLGAGIAGITSAYYLAQDGHDVTVVDRRVGSALETSFANACLLTPSQSLPWNSPGIIWQSLKWLLEESGALVIRPRLDPAMWMWLARFALNARHKPFMTHARRTLALASLTQTEIARICAEHAIGFDQTKHGILTLVRSEAGRAGAEVTRRWIAELDLRCRFVAPDEAVAIEPALQPVASRLNCALLTEGDGSGDIHKFCKALERILLGQGVKFHFGQTIRGLRVNNSRVAAVKLETGEIEADAFVLALGPGSREVAKGVGVKLRIYPVQGCSVTVSTAGWDGAPKMPVRDAALKVAVAPLDRHIRVAGMAILNSGETELPQRYFDRMRRALTDMFPTLPATQSAEYWTGLRPMTADGPPIIGPTPCTNLWLNTGHGPLGWTMSCGSAKTVAALVNGKPPPISLEGLTYDRYFF